MVKFSNFKRSLILTRSTTGVDRFLLEFGKVSGVMRLMNQKTYLSLKSWTKVLNLESIMIKQAQGLVQS